jgi:hypothetical protein
MYTQTASSPSSKTRKPWIAPNLVRLRAGAAENGLNPIREDGVFSMGS